MISFTNPGELDPRLIQLMGANVKPATDSPIGYFGTGLKYAIAVLLRHKGTITIWSGTKRIDFAVADEAIRGKNFQTVHMVMDSKTVALPFTLELGKNWELWMAYRELYCNALDEGGEVLDGPAAPKEGHTVIATTGLSEVHANRGEFILQSSPTLRTPYADIHPGTSTALFYRSIRASALPFPSIYTYNIAATSALTEDRTLADPYTIRLYLPQAIAQSNNRAVIDNILAAGSDNTYFESLFDWSWATTPSPTFLKTLTARAANHRSTLSHSARALARTLAPEAESIPASSLTSVQLKMLERARSFLRNMDVRLEHQVVVVASLEGDTLGMAKDRTIYLTKRCFDMGTKYVASTLFEEHCHLKHGYKDCSRSFQNFLLDRIFSLAEELQGEPL